MIEYPTFYQFHYYLNNFLFLQKFLLPYEYKDSQIIIGINLNEFDFYMEGLIPDKIPEIWKNLFSIKLKCVNFVKKIYKQIDCIDCKIFVE